MTGRFSIRVVCGVGATFALIACDGGSSGPLDAGPPDADVIEGIASPALPALTPCPEGWREVDLESGVSACDPWPAAGPESCGVGEVHWPGGAGCEPLGPPCGSDDFATDLPTDRPVIYVSGRPGLGGSGLRGDPYHSLFDAFAAASGGEIMALGRGEHVIAGAFPESVTFWGACVAETRLTADFADGVTGVITAFEGAEVELRNMRIVGPQPGVRVEEASTVILENVRFEGTGIAAIWAMGGSTVRGRHVVVRDTLGLDGEFGRALSIDDSRVALERVYIEGAREMAAQVMGAGARLELDDAAIRGTLPQASDEGWGRAIEVGEGASARLRRTTLEDNLEYGVFVGGSGTEAQVEDAVIRGTRERVSDGETGRGLHVQEGASLEARRVWIEDNREIGVYGSTEGGRLRLEDAVIRGTRARSADGFGGRGVQVQWGIEVELDRVWISGNEEHGFFVAEASATMTDLVVLGTRPIMGRTWGRGLEVLPGSQVEIVRARFDANTEMGIMVQGEGTEVRLRDVAVRATRAVDLRGGAALSVFDGAEVVGSQLRLQDNHDFGVYVDEASLTLVDVEVERTGPPLCDGPTCTGVGRGIGLVVVRDARASLSEFRIANNALAGVYTGAGGFVTLVDGEVLGHPIGIAAVDDWPDFEEQVRQVSFVDNERNVEGTTLPLPDPAVPGTLDF